MSKLFLELVSPERVFVSTEVDEVYAPGTIGDFGILPGHTAFFSSLRAGEFYYKKGSSVEYIALDGGYLEVSDNKITVLADEAEFGKDIDIDEAIKRKELAEAELRTVAKGDSKAFEVAEVRLKRELMRLSVAGRYK